MIWKLLTRAGVTPQHGAQFLSYTVCQCLKLWHAISNATIVKSNDRVQSGVDIRCHFIARNVTCNLAPCVRALPTFMNVHRSETYRKEMLDWCVPVSSRIEEL